MKNEIGTLEEQTTRREIPCYPVSLWEFLLITLGALGLIGLGTVGLGLKMLNNAFSPWRAEMIARSLIDYKIPGGSEGVFGVNVGGAKLASVRSQTTPPDVVLLVSKTPLNKDAGSDEQQALEQDLEARNAETTSNNFVVTASRTDNRLFCRQMVAVTIETGQQTFNEYPIPLPAVRYTAKASDATAQRLAILTVNGLDAEQKADQVFRTLECK